MDKLFVNKLFHKIAEMGFGVDTIRFKSQDSDIFCGKNSIVNIHSCAKTFTSIALGIAMGLYNIDLSDPIIKFFPSYKESAYDGTESIQLIDLLHMQAGKKLQSLLQDCGNPLWNEDWLAWFFEAPLCYAPGTKFYYSSHCCYVIGRLIQILSGEDVNDFLEKYFWNLLDIKKPYWSKCPKGFTNSAGNLMLSCLDLSKLGEVLLNNGQYGGLQICPSNYVEQMTKNIVNSEDPFDWNDVECQNGYGFLIWKCLKSQTYCSWGAGGTFCIVNYEKNCTITITSVRDDINWRNYNDHNILREVNKFIDAL